MTKKDFILIAQILKATKPLEGDSHLQYWQTICNVFANRLANDNPRFKRATFLSACGAL
jgi:hypothetical protein